MLRYHQIANDERRVLSLTSLTPKEFADLVPLFTTSFYEYLDEQTVEGYERIGRRYVAYRNSILPTMEDAIALHSGVSQTGADTRSAGKFVWHAATESKYVDSFVACRSQSRIEAA